MSVFHTCLDCGRECRSKGGLKKHQNAHHRPITPEDNDVPLFGYHEHQELNGRPCTSTGQPLPAHVGPTPPQPPPNAWEPFSDRIEFDFAFDHFVEDQSSAKTIGRGLDRWAASLLQHGASPPWRNAQEMYQTIDEIQRGPSPWKVHHLQYTGPLPPSPPKWMLATYDLCVRDTRLVAHSQLATPTFRDEIHYTPYQQFNREGKRVRSNLMSGDWAWRTADLIAQDPATHGAMLVPIIVGTDKTTVSVATGHQQYHPVYMSIGNLTNTARRAHTNAVLPVAFLPIPKATRKQRKRRIWQKFCRQLYHTCLRLTFLPLKGAMTDPEVVRCPDDHFRHAIYSMGPHVADYPEQVWLAAIVQTWCPKCFSRPDNLDAHSQPRTEETTEILVMCFDSKILWDDWGIRADVMPYTAEFPRADIHELITPDLLHQVIKGVFKDHLIKWVNEYLMQAYGEARALEIIQDIDRRISNVPAFPGLRRFPDGRDFQQWTGNDSKALMKVYLGAVAGYLPSEMVQCLWSFLDFAYLARQNSLSSTDIQKLEDALNRFTTHRESFAQEGFETSLPRQHSLRHYVNSIRLFGSPNGLCSSIMESKHIKAVKEPWRRSNRYNALIQMLRTIDRTDKLQAARADFTKQGMMRGTTLTYTAAILLGEIPPGDNGAAVAPDEWEHDVGPVSGPKDLSKVFLSANYEPEYPRSLNELGEYINQPELHAAVRRFLWAERNPESMLPQDQVPLEECPVPISPFYVHHSAVVCFYAPSDLCGAGGMMQERIRSNPSWRGGDARRDTVFVSTDANDGLGFTVARALLFFSFQHRGKVYSCALVSWYTPYDDVPDNETGMWIVCPEYNANQEQVLQVVPVDTIARAAHLIPVFGATEPVPEDFQFSWSLDSYQAFFVNPYADNHIHELLSQ